MRTNPRCKSRFANVAFAALLALSLPRLAAAQGVRFVDAAASGGGDGQSWTTAYQRLIDALDEAAIDPAIDQIWVAAGTYTPRRGAGNRNDTFTLVSGVGVFGGFAGGETDLPQRDPQANLTVLTGDLNNNDTPGFMNRGDNARHVITGADLTGGTLDGFTIRGGNADFPGDALLGGGGMHLHRSTFTVANCIFRDSTAGGTAPDLGGFGGALFIQGGNVEVAMCHFELNRGMNGGALGIFGSESDRTSIDTIARVRDCEFFLNFSPSQTGGAIWSATGDPLHPELGIIGAITLERCRFSINNAEYYGAWQDQNTPELHAINCVFENNQSQVAGGALAFSQSVGVASVAVISGCEFFGNRNTSSGGAAVFIQARPCLLDRCIIRDNIGPTAVRAGPLIGFSGGAMELEVRNCLIHDNLGTGVFGLLNPALRVFSSTIVRNTSGVGGGLAGGIETSAGVVEVSNTILWNNRRGNVMDEAAQIRSFSVAPTVDFCIVQGLSGALGGSGNLGADPLFVDPPADDFRPGPGSPAIDAGSNPLAPQDTLDIDGDGDTTERAPFDLAGSPRFLDDPATADTGIAGAGHTEIIDIGALEANPCPADLDADNQVGLSDLTILLAHFGQASGATFADGDLDGDTDVDLGDLAQLLAAFGSVCG